jgi:hypothetical protein
VFETSQAVQLEEIPSQDKHFFWQGRQIVWLAPETSKYFGWHSQLFVFNLNELAGHEVQLL